MFIFTVFRVNGEANICLEGNPDFAYVDGIPMFYAAYSDPEVADYYYHVYFKLNDCRAECIYLDATYTGVVCILLIILIEDCYSHVLVN